MENAPATDLLSLPSALWRGYRLRRYRRVALAALRRMDDHMLRDIGIHRGDLEVAIRGAGSRR